MRRISDLGPARPGQAQGATGIRARRVQPTAVERSRRKTHTRIRPGYMYSAPMRQATGRSVRAASSNAVDMRPASASPSTR